ncbi:MAG: DUF6134 family protein [Bacteroidia bacterium]|nr:DUF6134 family protein [Bacteroidia bacterium]
MRNILVSCICLFFFLILEETHAQTLVYKGYKGDDYIGDMIVKREVKGDQVFFHSEAILNVRFLLNWELRFYYEADFKGGDLKRSLVQLTRDGKLRTEVKGQREGSYYNSDVDGDKESLQIPNIDYCVLNTYFEAPKGRKKIFSERWGSWLTVEDQGNGRYILQPPNGSHNTLIYKNGICQEMQFNHTIAKVRFVLKE